MHSDDTCPDGAVRIPLRAKDGSIRAYAIVDAADAEWASQWRWSLDGNGYAERNGGQLGNIKLHRALLGLQRGDRRQVDHINRDTLDNTRGNLRVVPKAGNSQNLPAGRGSSKFRGVSWDRVNRRWEAYLTVNRRRIRLGRFNDEVEAAQISREARARLMPYATD